GWGEVARVCAADQLRCAGAVVGWDVPVGTGEPDRGGEFLVAGAPAATAGSGIDFERIKNPRPGDWLTYNGSLSGNRYSSLDQINTRNAARLGVKWMFPIEHFGAEVTPVVAD